MKLIHCPATLLLLLASGVLSAQQPAAVVQPQPTTAAEAPPVSYTHLKVSEDTLAEMKKGGTDTHNLAVAADTANQQSKAAARPWIGPVGGGPHSDIRFEPQKNGEIEATYIWRLNNSGKRPRSLCPGI